MSLSLDIDRQQIATFCQRWRIRELALFGSVLARTFQPQATSTSWSPSTTTFGLNE
jgi:hypothetical protein